VFQHGMRALKKELVPKEKGKIEKEAEIRASEPWLLVRPQREGKGRDEGRRKDCGSAQRSP